MTLARRPQPRSARRPSSSRPRGIRTELGRAAGARLRRARRRRARPGGRRRLHAGAGRPPARRASSALLRRAPGAPSGAGFTGLARVGAERGDARRGSGTRSACKPVARSVTRSKLSTDVRGPDRRPGRAQERSAAGRAAAPEHVPEVRVALPRRRARRRALGLRPLRPPLPDARARADRVVADAGSFVEEAADVRSDDPLDFFDLRPYAERLAEAELNTGLGEAIVIGQATIDGHPVELAVMDFSFMGGSMGSAVGEKFSRACDSAIERGVPLVCRHELRRRAHAGGDPLADAAAEDGLRGRGAARRRGCRCSRVMAHPTTAGVLACFASLGDVTIAEPGALIAFTGPRVVQQTTREKLPDDFGLAEQNLRFGHIDAHRPATRAARVPGAAPAALCRPVRPSCALRERLGQAVAPAAAARHAASRARRSGSSASSSGCRRTRRDEADLALGRARAPPRPAVHARLRRADPRRLGRAARRPRPRRRRRARHRASASSTAARSRSSATRRAAT